MLSLNSTSPTSGTVSLHPSSQQRLLDEKLLKSSQIMRYVVAIPGSGHIVAILTVFPVVLHS